MRNKLTGMMVLMVGLSFPTFLLAKDMTGAGQMSPSSSGHVMSHEMMRNMPRLMQQMQIMTKEMNRIMDNSGTMDKVKIREMAQVMEKLSLAMRKMSQHMLTGSMDKNMFQEMEQQMNQISSMLKTLEQKK